MSAKSKNESAIPEESLEIGVLIEKCAQGDISALQEFFQQYSLDIYNFPIRVFYLSEDEASDFFLYAFERLRNGKRFASFAGRSRFRTWFYTVLRNLVIDWMRSVKELDTVQMHVWQDSQGRPTELLNEIVDPGSAMDDESNRQKAESLHTVLGQLPLEQSIMLKLAYIYYFDLDVRELQWLARRKDSSREALLQELEHIRDELRLKAERFREVQDQLTALYLGIWRLKWKVRQSESGQERAISGVGASGPDDFELNKMRDLLAKKIAQRDRLLARYNKGQLIVKTPHAHLADLLGVSAAGISVNLARIAEKIEKGLLEMQ
ncbi:MAG: sigma-70 family RNA polymerase sigma factor [Leptospiraceae bacterium]|nr:sigma-70 family RNA polymerase sigma factor [Leptospiraceae bacterium]